MANTLTVFANLKDGTRIYGDASKTVITVGDNYDVRRIAVPTGSETTFTFISDIGDAGQVWLRNKTTSGYITYGFVAKATQAHPLRLPAGESAVFALIESQASILFERFTAAQDVEIAVYEK